MSSDVYYTIGLIYGDECKVNSPEASAVHREIREVPKHRAILNGEYRTKRKAEAARKKLPNPERFNTAETFAVFF
ncbi:MAG: hypothetical protein ABGZ24_12600 [Fuerstiella sp.]